MEDKCLSNWWHFQSKGEKARKINLNVFIKEKVRTKSLQSNPTLCESMNYSPPGSSVHGIFQARILEWVAVPSWTDLPDPGNYPSSHVSCTGKQVLYVWSHLGSPHKRLPQIYSTLPNRIKSMCRVWAHYFILDQHHQKEPQTFINLS